MQKFNPLLRSGFEQVEDASSIIVQNPDGSEITVTGLFQQIINQLKDKLDIDALPTYAIDVVDTEEGYLRTYQLSQTVKGVKTMIPYKINIPRDFFLRNVELLVVDDEHPVEGLEKGRYFKFTFVIEGGNERIQILPVSDLGTCVDAGEHISLDGTLVNAHSFVPEYDSVSKVLPHEKIFHYIGETTDKFTHGYIYERKLVSKPVTETKDYFFPAGTEYLDVLVDGYQLPKGRYYKLPADEQKPDEIVSSLRNRWTMPYPNNKEFLYQSAPDAILKVGDKIWTYGDYSENTEFLTITEIIVSNQGYLYRIKVSNGLTLETSSGGGRGYKHGYFVSASGVTAFVGDVDGFDHYIDQQFLCQMQYIGVVREELYKGVGHPCLYYDGLGFVPNTARINVLDQDISQTITYTHGEEVWEWVQLDVQPSSIPYDPTALIQRIEELETKSHAQNTDTQLKDGKLKLESNKISATLPIVSSGDIQGTDTTSNTTHLLSKKLNADMLRMYSSWSAMESDKSNIPEGAWVAITEY